MNKNTIIIIVIIVVLVIAGIFLVTNRAQEPAPEDGADTTLTDGDGNESDLDGESDDSMIDLDTEDPGSTAENPAPISDSDLGAPVSSGPKLVIVSYTDRGFEPSAVTINAGDTVQFVNKSSSDMWVASAVHPTHETLPEFDQNASVGFNGVYEFMFDESGQWSYHNHRQAGDTGMIVVQ